jgi:hypothetical protein
MQHDLLKKEKKEAGMVVQACDPSTWEAEAGGWRRINPAGTT